MLPPLNRRKPEILRTLRKIDQKDHDKLKELGTQDNKFWNTKDASHADLVATFKSEVKRYYWERQSRMCCYCSKELDESKATYDAEHIIPKNKYPRFMFELTNLSVACKTCNGVKKIKTSFPARFPHRKFRTPLVITALFTRTLMSGVPICVLTH